MSSFIKKSMIVAVALSVGSSLYALDHASGNAEVKHENHMTLTGHHSTHDSSAASSSQNAVDNTKTVEKAKLAPQTTCPVMGGNIDKAVHADYKGKRVYFCCTMCSPTFIKDPENYIKKLESMGQGVETVATNNNGSKTTTKDTCPVKKGNPSPMKCMDHNKM